MTSPEEAITARDEAQATILEAIKKAHAKGVKITRVNAWWSGSLTVDGKDVYPPVQVTVEAQVDVAFISGDFSNRWHSFAGSFRPENGRLIAELKPKR